MDTSHSDLQPLQNRRSLADALAALSAQSDYAQGVLDLLRLLGLVEDRNGILEPAGEVSALFLASLVAHLRDGTRFSFDWDDLDGEGVRGVDLLRVVESARAQAVPDPTPTRVVKVVQAIVKSRECGEDRYLMQYDRHAGRFQPLGGKQEPDEDDPGVALRRELAEELELESPPGPELCELNLLQEEWRTFVPSATYGVLTRYTFTFFHVVNARFPIRLDSSTCWLRREEIARSRADGGCAISSIYLEALGMARLDALGLSLG